MMGDIRMKDGMVEMRLTLDPEVYESIVEYLNSDAPSEISMFVEEVVMSYVEMHSELFDDEDIEK
jgi:predicted Zn-dependent protease with MMP-like domain